MSADEEHSDFGHGLARMGADEEQSDIGHGVARMGADEERLVHGELTDRVLRAFYDVYNALGAGFLESVYENALRIRLLDDGIVAIQQAPVAVYYRDAIVGEFRPDLAVDDRLVIEIKAASSLAASHEAQLMNYLKATRRPVGLLLNFGPKPEFKRRIYTVTTHNPAFNPR